MANGEVKWQTRGYLSVDQSAVSSGRIAREGGEGVSQSISRFCRLTRIASSLN